MMMPANYSAIAENEMSYVVGGGVIEFLGSFTAPVFTVANLKTLNTNIVTLIGNRYLGGLIDNTLGLVFGGYVGAGKDGATWANIKEKNVFTGIYNNLTTPGQVGDGIASIIGTGAALYNLGNATVANKASSAAISVPKGDDVTLVKILSMPNV